MVSISSGSVKSDATTVVEAAIQALCDPDSEWVELERRGRLGKVSAYQCEMIHNTWPKRTLLDDLVLCCWHKTVENFDGRSRVRSHALAWGLK